jgi:hypothetical protein
MFTFPDLNLKIGPISKLLQPFGIKTFHEAVHWVWRLPYGRTSDRSNNLLVPVEQKGACSAKHAFLAHLAFEQEIALELIIGIFMMNQSNTPGIGSTLLDKGLESIPEAHCYLRFQNTRYDFTSFSESAQPTVNLDIIHEEKIQPTQIGQYKIDLHKRWMDNWAQNSKVSIGQNELWALREKCIAALSESQPKS